MLTGQPDRRFNLGFPATLDRGSKSHLRNASEYRAAVRRPWEYCKRFALGYSGDYPNENWYVRPIDEGG